MLFFSQHFLFCLLTNTSTATKKSEKQVCIHHKFRFLSKNLSLFCFSVGKYLFVPEYNQYLKETEREDENNQLYQNLDKGS